MTKEFEILTGKTWAEFEAYALEIDEKKYRGRQLYKWIYEKQAASFDEMTDLPLDLRSKLKDVCHIGTLNLVETSGSREAGSVKYLFQLDDGHAIESVLIEEEGRKTLCVSSQVGCALNCRFCATAKLGFSRNLTAGEIVEQVLYVSRDIRSALSNIVFMGMGEPFNNYDNVIKAAALISDDNGISIGARHIVISTAGVVENIYRYADEGHKYKLAVSLNSPFQDERQQLMPVSRQAPLAELLQAVSYYAKKSKKIPTFEYVLFAGLNDSQKHAHALKKIVTQQPCKLNLIPYNPTVEQFKRPTEASVDQFTQWLLPLGVALSVRWSKGADIDAACGQLAGKRKGTENV